MKKLFSGKIRTVLILALLLSVVLAVGGKAMNINVGSVVVQGQIGRASCRERV